MSLWRCTLGLAVLLSGCGGDEAPERALPAETAVASPEVTEGPGRSYERTLMFLSFAADTPVVQPWVFQARTRLGGVERHVTAWLYRSDAWEQFMDVAWDGPPSRAPWRLLPHDPMGLVVGESDALEHVLFRQPPRELDLLLGEQRADWSGPRGEEVRVLLGSLSVAGTSTPGAIVDLNRNWRPAEHTPGDWLVLTSGDSLQVVLEGEGRGGSAAYRGWARVDDRETQWPDVSVEWTEVRSFEPARRDVPNRWTVQAADGELGGEVSVRSSRLQAGSGEGPQLPLEALFLLQGTVTLYGVEYPILGLALHAQS
ncbi:MAG: hypothetical protein R3E98_19060 [Gemmatimonadota bacterium]|nr:hypothetical protein [Gemmatimonadota bacterium]